MYAVLCREPFAMTPAQVADLTDAQIDAILSHHPDDAGRRAAKRDRLDASDPDDVKSLFFSFRRMMGMSEDAIAAAWEKDRRGDTGA